MSIIWINILKLALCIGVSFLPGIIGGFFTTAAVREWYPTLIKPAFTPPSWLFGPVWSGLYTTIGIALFLAINSTPHPLFKRSIAVFAFQMVLNALWSVVFFGQRSILGGLVIILLLWAGIMANIVLFSYLSKTAAALLVPYVLWVTFAAGLNLAIWLLNKPTQTFS